MQVDAAAFKQLIRAAVDANSAVLAERAAKKKPAAKARPAAKPKAKTGAKTGAKPKTR